MSDNQDRRLLRSFVEVGVSLTQELDVTSVLTSIVERSRDLTGARYGAAATLTDDGRVGDFVHRGLTPEQVAALPHYPEGRGLLGLVLQERKPVRCEVLGDHPASVGFPDRHVPMDAFLGVPIDHRGSLVGALYLTKPPGDPPFGDTDVELVVAMASMAAVGIINARLFARETKRAERLGMLRETAAEIRRSLDAAEILSATVETVGRAARVDRCFVRLTRPDGEAGALGDISFEWCAPGVESIRNRPEIQYPVASLTALTRATQSSEDVTADPRLDDPRIAGSVRNMLDHDAHSALATPIEWGDELLGVLGFHAREPRTWTKAEVSLIESTALEVGVALHHAHLYDEALRTAEKLRQLDELRSEFVSMVSHELRSPMTVVAGIGHILRTRAARLSDEQRDELIETLEREAQRLSRLVSDVLDLEAIEQGRLALKPIDVDMGDLAREAATDGGAVERTDVSIASGDPLVSADRDRIKQVLLNLISNAAKFSPDDARITVDVAPEEEHVRVSVTDRGPGIRPEDLPRLFERFSRLHMPGVRKPGSGLGLFLSKTILDRHGGRIWAESTPGQGSTFRFLVPRVPPLDFDSR
jgi:signal transduction histidine kinase